MRRILQRAQPGELGTPNRFVNAPQFGTVTGVATPDREVQFNARMESWANTRRDSARKPGLGIIALAGQSPDCRPV